MSSKNTGTYKSLKKYLDYWERRSVSTYIDLGSHWYFSTFLPKLRAFEKIKRTKEDSDILAGLYYLIGDVSDFNGAHKNAIKSYKKSIEYHVSPKRAASSWRELACMYERIGHYEKAIHAAKTSLSLDPSEEFSRAHLDDAREGIENNTPPCVDITKKAAISNDYLIENKLDKVLELLKNKKDLNSLINIANAFTLKGDTAGYIKTWRQIEKKGQSIRLAYSEWFYMSDDICNTTDFWKIWLNIARKNLFEPSAFRNFDIVVQKNPIKSKEHKTKQFCKEVNRQYREYIKIQIALSSNNLQSLRKINEKYPGIYVVKRAIKRLSK